MRKHKPKVIFIGPLPPPHMGPSLATEIILNSDLKEKYDLVHLDTSDHRNLNKLAKYDLINFYLGFKQYFDLVKLIINCKPDLVYLPICQTTIGYLRDSIVILISKLFSIKVLCHLRGGNFKNWLNQSTWLTKKYVNMIHSFVDGQIVLGDSLRYMFDGLISSKKIFVCPNARDFKNTFNNKKELVNIDKSIFRILFLSNLIKEKGVIDVLQSAKILLKKRSDIEFYFAGSARSEYVQEELITFAKENDYKNIKLVGKVIGDAKWSLYSNSDIFVLPTYYSSEGHPWVIVEALAASLPIISTNHAAINESVFESFNGFFVRKKSPNEIAEKIEILINDHKLITKFGNESRKIYEKYFTENEMVNKFDDIFQKVIFEKF